MGRRHGLTGTMRYSNGDVYVGTWFQNQRHEYGKIVYVAGGEYEGAWTADKRGGPEPGLEGTLVLDGERYVGLWRMDRMIGRQKRTNLQTMEEVIMVASLIMMPKHIC